MRFPEPSTSREEFELHSIYLMRFHITLSLHAIQQLQRPPGRLGACVGGFASSTLPYVSRPIGRGSDTGEELRQFLKIRQLMPLWIDWRRPRYVGLTRDVAARINGS